MTTVNAKIKLWSEMMRRQATSSPKAFVLAGAIAIVCLLALIGHREHNPILAGVGSGCIGFVAASAIRRSPRVDEASVFGILDQVAMGDLRLSHLSRPSDGRLLRRARLVGLRLSQVVAEVRSQAVVVAHEGEALGKNTELLADVFDQDATALEQTSAALQELNGGVRRSAMASTDVDRLAQEIRVISLAATEESAGAYALMERIHVRANEVASALKVVEETALQTNILAINAAIEAAHAGNRGRSFAVLAQEIRGLARTCATAASSVREVAANSASSIADGLTHVDKSRLRLSEVERAIERLAEASSSIAVDMREQSAAISQISEAVAHVDQSTQRMAGVVRDSSDSAKNLSSRAANLAASVRTMQLHQGTADEAISLVRKALLHIEKVGLAFALRDFHEHDAAFIDRDLYIVVFDRVGTYVAQGAKPEFVGRSLSEMKGLDAQHLLSSAIRAADAGGGWIEYRVLNPTTGEVQDKISYFSGCAGQLLMGCGVFRTVSSG